ncbi:hypothetical protein C0991_003211 [Blastosporella zonata]|nr:hypothetical protein C0991_003211 [Blastosporella zonata]
MTFAHLRALHAILADALDDIERIYSPAKEPWEHGPPSDGQKASYVSPPPSPLTSPGSLDFPSLDAPCDPNNPAEQLTAHPVVVQAINKIVAAAGQMSMTVQAPFYSLCDASMAYHLSSCMRLLEASHTVEILREAGPNGLHVNVIAQRNGVDSGKLAHILRLLATHHFLREQSPNVFALNRISSLVDSGKSFEEIKRWQGEGRPEMKYRDTNGVAAFVGLCSDELFKSSAYLTEAYLIDRDDPSRPPFGHAFDTDAGYFAWLEGEGGYGRKELANNGRLRLERFGKAMSGTNSWETPGAVFHGFDWRSLPRGSVIVDVGGGIGSSSMLLANAFCSPSESRNEASPLPSPPLSDFPILERENQDEDFGFKFVIQDRPVVVEMGEKLREAATPETKLVLADFVLPLACVDVDAAEDPLSSGVLDEVEGAESRIALAPLLANLGKASASAYWMDLTMQVIFNAKERTLRETTSLALSAGWKVVKATRSPGSLFGHIVAVPVSIPMHRRARAGSGSALLDVPQTTQSSGDVSGHMSKQELRDIERTSSRCGTPTFGSRTDLPSMQEALARFGGGIRSRIPRPPPVQPEMLKQAAVITNTTSLGVPPVRKKKPSPLALSSPKPSSPSPIASPRLTSPHPSMRRRSSVAHLRSPSQQGPGSPVPPLPRDRQAPPSPMSPRDPYSIHHTLVRRGSNAHLTHTPTRSLTAVISPSSQSLPVQETPASPPPRPRTLLRPKSLAHLYQTAQSQSPNPARQLRSPVPPLPPPLRTNLSPSSHYPPGPPPGPPPRQGPIPRRASHASAPQTNSIRKRSGSVIVPPIGGAGIGGAISMTSLLRVGGVRGSGGGTLNFGKGNVREEPQPEPAGEGKVSVLAAAARIERGTLSRPSTP